MERFQGLPSLTSSLFMMFRTSLQKMGKSAETTQTPPACDTTTTAAKNTNKTKNNNPTQTKVRIEPILKPQIKWDPSEVSEIPAIERFELAKERSE